MKRFSFITLLVFISLLSQAQESWKITLNNKVLVNAREENELKNTVSIKSSDWKKNGNLGVSYTGNGGAWKYSFVFEDENGNQLFSKDSSTSFTLPLASLRKTFAGKKQVRIYIIVSPSNDRMASRMRKVHLCTLTLLH